MIERGRLWRSLAAVFVFLIGAYAAFLLTHIPQAAQAARLGRWSIGDSETLTLVRPSPGRLASVTLQGAGALSVTAATGSALVEPSPATLRLLAGEVPGFQMADTQGPIGIRVVNEAASSATLTVDLPGGERNARVEISPVTQLKDSGFTIFSPDADLVATLTWITEPPQKAETGLMLVGVSARSLPLVRVPAGKALSVSGPLGGERSVTLGDPFAAPPGVPIEAATIGEGASIRNLVCAAPRDRKLRWPAWTGGIRPTKCSGPLRAIGFVGDTPRTMQFDQPAFSIVDGEARYLPLLKNVASNFVLQGVFVALNAALTLWIMGAFKRRA